MEEPVNLLIRVPANREAEVHQFVGQLWAEESRPATSVEVSHRAGNSTNKAEILEAMWTEPKVRELWRRCRSGNTRLFLRRLAEASPNGIDKDAVARDLGKSKGGRSVAGVSGAVGHSCGSMGIKDPWVWEDLNYKMPMAIAARLLKVANGG